MDFDANGNPDVMGPRKMGEDGVARTRKMQDAFNDLHQKCMGAPTTTGEAARLYAIARTHLELASMAAVKAISRE